MRYLRIYVFLAGVVLFLFAKAGLAVRSGTARSWKYLDTYHRATNPAGFWRQVASDACFGAALLFGIVSSLIKGG